MSIMNKTDTKTFSIDSILLLFFAIAALYPTIRILLIGSDTSSSFWHFILSGINELLIIIILLIGIQSLRKNAMWFSRIHPFDKAILFYFLLNIILGTILSADIKLATYGFRLTYVPILFYFIGRLFLFNKKEQQEKIIHSLFFLLTFISTAGLILYFFFPSVIETMMAKGKYFQSIYFIPRMGSILWNPIFFASLAAVSAIYYYARLQSRLRFIELIFFIIHFSCLVLTVSRGALIAFVFSYLFISIYKPNIKSTLFISALMLSILFIIMISLTGSTNVVKWIIYSTGTTMELRGNVSRVELWSRSWIDFKNQPLGYGLGKAGHVAHRFLLDSPIPASRWSTDGWYLKHANETGIIGIVSFLILLYSYFKTIIRKVIIRNNIIMAFFFAVGLFVLTQNVVSNVLDFYYFSYVFWFLIGCSVNKFVSLTNA
jgi:hypothetical protein